MARYPTLAVDPARQFGRLCIAGTRVPVSSVAPPVIELGESLAEVADDFGVTRDEVALAVAHTVCPHGLVSHHRKWKKDPMQVWAIEVWTILGGHAAGPVSDPPSSR